MEERTENETSTPVDMPPVPFTIWCKQMSDLLGISLSKGDLTDDERSIINI